MRRIWSPSKTLHRVKIHVQCCTPLAYDHRPLTTYPPSLTSALPWGKMTPAVTTLGLRPKISSTAVSVRFGTNSGLVLDSHTHQAVEPSIRASASTTRVKVSGSTSSPPRVRGV